jgi:hypothetical protein
MSEIFGIDSLFANLTLALGAAMMLGNGFAWWQNRKGRHPEESTEAFQPRRAAFLVAVGSLMTLWAMLSLLQ